MQEQATRTAPKSRLFAVLIFLAGLAAFFLSAGRYNLSVCAWIWPACLLYTVRHTRRVLPMLGIAVLSYAVLVLCCVGIVDTSVNDLFIVAISFAEYALAFALDRAFYPALKRRIGAASVLFFPLVYVSLLALGQLLIVIAYTPDYTQTGLPALMQAAAVIGARGLTVLVFCFSTVLLYVIESRDRPASAKRAAAVYGAVLLLTVLAGSARLAFSTVRGDYTVKVAANATALNIDDNDIAPLSEDFAVFQDRARRAAAGEAEILCFGEEAFFLAPEEVDAFQQMAAETARENHLCILVPVEISAPKDGSGQLALNKEFMFSADGELLVDYTKTKLVPLLEDTKYETGDGNIPFSEITLKNGRTLGVSSLICFDSDTALYAAQMDDRTQLLMVPSWCWSAMDPFHNSVERFRAIENGVSLLNPTVETKSIALDWMGDIISFSDTRVVEPDCLTFSDVPIREPASPTPFRRIGAVLNVIYAAAAAALLIVAVIECLRSRKSR